jgi:hypothetical protein
MNAEVLPLGVAAGVPTPSEWAALVTAFTPPVSLMFDIHPDRTDLSVTGDGAIRPLAWRDGALLLPTGRWVGAWLTTPDGRREVRRWWEWDELRAHESKVIRDEMDVQQYATRRLALRRVMLPKDPSRMRLEQEWPNYVDAGDLERALAEDLAVVRDWRATEPPDLHDAATVYALGERLLRESCRSAGPWGRFARSLQDSKERSA